MKFTVVEVPFIWDYARECWRDSLARGEYPLMPAFLVSFYKPLAPGDNAVEAHIAWHDKADALVVYTDNGISDSTLVAIRRALTAGIPVEYRVLQYKGTAEVDVGRL